MDDIRDLKEIEQEFGKLPLGHEVPADPLLEETKFFSEFAPRPVNRQWFQLAKIFNYGPSKMEKFLSLVDKAICESKSDYETVRRKSLEQFYASKKRKRADELAVLFDG